MTYTEKRTHKLALTVLRIFAFTTKYTVSKAQSSTYAVPGRLNEQFAEGRNYMGSKFLISELVRDLYTLVVIIKVFVSVTVNQSSSTLFKITLA